MLGMYEHSRTLPMAGGLLDQTASFLHAIPFYQNQKSAIRAEIEKRR